MQLFGCTPLFFHAWGRVVISRIVRVRYAMSLARRSYRAFVRWGARGLAPTPLRLGFARTYGDRALAPS